jgi:hypothetical protein
MIFVSGTKPRAVRVVCAAVAAGVLSCGLAQGANAGASKTHEPKAGSVLTTNKTVSNVSTKSAAATKPVGTGTITHSRCTTHCPLTARSGH